MTRKWFIALVIVGILFLGSSVLIWGMTPTPAAAQCGSNPPPDSSCYTCHVEQNPIYESGLWHGVHARKDCCAKCHGGNCSTMDKDLAHQGMVSNPLSDIYTDCHSCHPDDYLERAEVFAGELGITPGSIPTPTPAPAGKLVASSIVILPSSISGQTSTFPWPAILGGLTIIVLFLFGIITLMIHLRP
jgi:hypothetical protein